MNDLTHAQARALNSAAMNDYYGEGWAPYGPSAHALCERLVAAGLLALNTNGNGRYVPTKAGTTVRHKYNASHTHGIENPRGF